MPPVKKASTKSKPRAARREVKQESEPLKIEVRGLTLTMNGSAPPGSMMYDALGLGASEGDRGEVRFLNTVFDVDQLEQVRAKMDADGMGIEEATEFLRELVEAVSDAFGVAPGESQASASPSRSDGTSSRRTSSGSTA